MSVLIVEDETSIAELLRDALLLGGYEIVITVATVPEALAVLAAITFDKAIVDITLAGDDATAVLDRLTELEITPVISTGGVGAPAKYSHLATLLKPYSLASLLEALA